MQIVSRCLLAAVAFGVAAACNDTGGSNPDNPELVIAKTATNSGDGQAADVTEALPQPLRVIVTTNGNPVEGQDITWAVPADGGTVAPATATTDADGIAAGAWTFGTKSGSFTATATLSGAGGSPVSFTATAGPDVASQFTIADGNNQSGIITTPFDEPLRVKMQDQYGNNVAGENVNWAITLGTAELSGAVSATNGGGIASITATFGLDAGPIVVQASPQNALPAVEFNATANAPPTEITIQVQNNFFTPSVDTVAKGGTVTWTWVGSGHNVTSNPSPGLLDSGTHNSPFTYEIVFPTAGTFNYRCTEHPPNMVGTIVVIG